VIFVFGCAADRTLHTDRTQPASSLHCGREAERPQRTKTWAAVAVTVCARTTLPWLESCGRESERLAEKHRSCLNRGILFVLRKENTGSTVIATVNQPAGGFLRAGSN